MMPVAWQGQVREVLLEGITVEDYLAVEKKISEIYRDLNGAKRGLKNRDAIHAALKLAIDRLPKLNPSDIYHHIVYRLYLREYSRTQADRSWVRAGGQAVELFIQEHYNPTLHAHGVRIHWLGNDTAKAAALKQMKLTGEVGGSKLDIALVGAHQGREVVFGGIHVKASLAERVSDDVPCSEAMMARGYTSYLFTLDAKSYPPPTGDLVNRGELGSPSAPSDKRKYIEEHGSFDACFSYNLRTNPSSGVTASGKKIFVSSFDPATDPLPTQIVQSWKAFQLNLK